MNNPGSVERLHEVVRAYGANSANWPVDERDELLKLADAAAPELLAAKQLDTFLDEHEVVALAPDLGRRIISSTMHTTLRTTLLDRVIQWAWPEQPALLWKPALVACLPLLAGIILGSNVTLLDESENLDDEGIYLMGLYTVEEANP